MSVQSLALKLAASVLSVQSSALSEHSLALRLVLMSVLAS
jgi:hypothetical protein